jgi:hypothetical protein
MSEFALSEQSLLPSAATIERLALSESGFLFDPVTGHSFTLNETAIAVLRSLQKTRSVAALRDGLLAEYDVDAVTLDRDLLEFLGSLRDQLARS